MDKRVMQLKFSIKQSPAVFVLVSCALPIAATILDLLRNGLPFSFSSILAVHTTQPLHWVIDSVPVLVLLLTQALARNNPATAAARPSTNSDGQGATTAKAGQLVNELKNELAKQRRAQETLRASEEFYRNLVENTNDGVATISVDGTITSVNRGFERMLGRLREEMIGKHYSAILSVSSLGTVEDRIRRFHGGEKLTSLFELELLHQNNTPIVVEARTRPIIDKNGSAIGFQGVYRDIAKRTAMKKGGAAAGVATDVATSTAMPWEKPSPPANTEAQSPLPGNYSPISRRAEAPPDSTLAKDEEKLQLSGAPASEKFSGSLSTAQSASAPSHAAAEAQSVSPPPSAFRFADSSSRPLPSGSSTSTPAASSEATAAPLQFTLATDRAKKDERPAKVVPFPVPTTSSSTSEHTLNLAEALMRVEGDRGLLCEMAGVFLEEYPMLLVTMQDALSHGNAQTLTFAVHTLKGSVANFAATNAFEAALKLEKIARQGNLPQAKAALAELEAELARLVPVLNSLKMEIAA